VTRYVYILVRDFKSTPMLMDMEIIDCYTNRRMAEDRKDYFNRASSNQDQYYYIRTHKLVAKPRKKK
jgi:hypothetical protein